VDFLIGIWNGLLDGLAAILATFQGVFEPIPLVGAWSWAFSIIALTVVVRVLLLPLAIKQTRSMRAMQSLKPEIDRIQKKYKADRSMMKTDPEKYRARKQKQQEETMKLYKEHNVNPLGGCLPLLAQMPIFIAMFRLLTTERADPLQGEGFLLVDDLTVNALQGAGIGAWFLVLAMGITMYVSQRQMMANNPASADNPQMKIMLYLMPVMLTIFAMNFPVGLVLYWVTTNLWTMGQQYVMFRGASAPQPAKAKS